LKWYNVVKLDTPYTYTPKRTGKGINIEKLS